MNEMIRDSNQRAGIAALALAMAMTEPASGEIISHTVSSAYQSGDHEIRVLLPDSFHPGRRYPVVYVLPVETEFNSNYGYPLQLIQAEGFHNVYDSIFVQMGFEKEPWFGDHPNNLLIRQESYLRNFVVPFIESTYGAREDRAGRLLIGFSKSGWGALSLLFRNPDSFGYAAAWDAPWMLNNFHYGMALVFGTLAQLDLYRPDLLAISAKAPCVDERRFALGGEKAWGALIPPPGGSTHTQAFETILAKEGLLYIYDDTLDMAHRWDSGWLPVMLQQLMELACVSPITHAATFDSWKACQNWPIPGTDDLLLADPDQDGIVNAAEYAFGLDPLAIGATGLPSATIDPNDGHPQWVLTYRCRRNAADLSCVVEQSTDLVTWTEGTGTSRVVNSDADENGAVELVEYATPDTQFLARRYFRVKAIVTADPGP